MRVTRGRVVLAEGQEQPYIVVLDDEQGGRSEHLVGTMREGEAMIRARIGPARPEDAAQMRQSPHHD